MSFSTQVMTQEIGLASYYSLQFHGRKTANGEFYNKDKYTAAHRTLAFGTIVRVTNLRNNKSVVVKVTDRGPHRRSRIIDLSYIAAEDIGLIHHGVSKVKIEVIGSPSDFIITKLPNMGISQLQHQYISPAMRKLEITLPDTTKPQTGKKRKGK